METFPSMFYSLVLLIKTYNTYISIHGVIFNMFQEILIKKQLAEVEVAGAEAG